MKKKDPFFKKVANFSISYLQILDENGTLVQEFPEHYGKEDLLEIYKSIILSRTFDQKAVHLQRAGKIGTYPSSLGQEGVSSGIVHALNKEDIFFPSYRDQAVLMQRGLSIKHSFAWWAGDERGNIISDDYDDFPPCVPVSTQCLHGVGAAYTIKYRNQSRAVLVCLGDGATSKGDFYEAINLAGVWDLPIVFVINNNQWAISVPLHKQTRCQTLAQKAVAGGIKAFQVDGNDPIATHYGISYALEKARNDHQPFVVEAITYRLFDHTTADDAKRYRPTEEVEDAWAKEPLKRLETFLITKGYLTDEQKARIYQEIKNKIDQGIQEFLSMKEEPAAAIMEYLYKSIPESMLSQYHELKVANGSN